MVYLGAFTSPKLLELIASAGLVSTRCEYQLVV